MGDEMDGERLEVPSLGNSGRETGEDMDERLEVPSFGERMLLFGGIGGLDWGLVCGVGGWEDSVPREDVLQVGLGQQKAGLLGSLCAVGLK